MFINFEIVIKNHNVDRINLIISSPKEAVAMINFLQLTDTVIAFKMTPVTLEDLGLSKKSITKFREGDFTKEDYDPDSKLKLSKRKSYPQQYITGDGFVYTAIWSPNKEYKLWICRDRKLAVMVNYLKNDDVSSVWSLNTDKSPNPVIGRIKLNKETGKYSFRLDSISDAVEYFIADTPQECEHLMMSSLTSKSPVAKMEKFWFYDIEIPQLKKD